MISSMKRFLQDAMIKEVWIVMGAFDKNLSPFHLAYTKVEGLCRSRVTCSLMILYDLVNIVI